MRRLGVGGFDALEFDAFDGLGNFLLERLHFCELTTLFEHDLVELIVLMFEVGQIGFEFFQAFGEFFVHGGKISWKAWRRQCCVLRVAVHFNLNEVVEQSPRLTRPRDYLGKTSERLFNLEEVVPKGVESRSQPLRGWRKYRAFPRVALSSQPWALGRNLVEVIRSWRP